MTDVPTPREVFEDIEETASVLEELQQVQNELEYLHTENSKLTRQRGDLTRRLKKAEREIGMHVRGLAKDAEIIRLRQRVYDLEVSKADLRYDEVNRIGIRFGYALRVREAALEMVQADGRVVATFAGASASVGTVLDTIRRDRARLRGAI
jgi:phage-related tail protein